MRNDDFVRAMEDAIACLTSTGSGDRLDPLGVQIAEQVVRERAPSLDADERFELTALVFSLAVLASSMADAAVLTARAFIGDLPPELQREALIQRSAAALRETIERMERDDAED